MIKNKVITIGEVLMRLTVPNNKRFSQADAFEANYGGSEANVGISLAHLGLDWSHITALPNHDLGKRVGMYLASHGMRNEGLVYRDGRLGIYMFESGAMQRSSKIIYDRFDSAFSLLQVDEIDWDSIFENATWFHYSGITPAISQSTADITLKALQMAKEKGLTTSGDINYRRNLWQYGKSPRDIMPELVKLTDVVVGGRVDLENCLGIHDEDWVVNCQKVQEVFPNVHKFSKTIRETYSAAHNNLTAVLFDGEKLYTSQSYDMNGILDRIGGGDAYMAGLIYGLIHETAQDAIDFSCAASVLKHTVMGDSNNCTVEEIKSLMSGNNNGRLLR